MSRRLVRIRTNRPAEAQPARRVLLASQAGEQARSAISAPRAVANPRAAMAADILSLQRAAGNRAVTALLQRALPASDQVMQRTPVRLSGRAPAIQRLSQDLPYVGPLLSTLNPLNQAARLVLPGLSPSQKALLDGIFGNSLATSIIRLNPNSIVATGHCYRTTGNIINMPGTTIDDDHLIHEAAHVWQSQNSIFGVGYAVSALRAMAIAQVLGGDWQKAYDYSKVERYHIPWRYWNAEQQADWIMDHRRLPSGWMLEAALPDFTGNPAAGGLGLGPESTGL